MGEEVRGRTSAYKTVKCRAYLMTITHIDDINEWNK